MILLEARLLVMSGVTVIGLLPDSGVPVIRGRGRNWLNAHHRKSKQSCATDCFPAKRCRSGTKSVHQGNLTTARCKKFNAGVDLMLGYA
ncbi:hypothetical protein [Stutzerimonas nitrititolerans]|uniref:hypothetical protein n=1 Tax=Stutzerimonas nitrititolerans TaxID=2482751 RepID=UPI000F79C561|nr:hypothetical protein [Stutzerimonas nitrititolerans]